MVECAGQQQSIPTLGLKDAWNKIQMNQELEGANYAEVDPRYLPQWDAIVVSGTRTSSNDGRDQQIDWLNQDSIESLKQASASFTVAPNSARRVDPIRLSVPSNRPPVT